MKMRMVGGRVEAMDLLLREAMASRTNFFGLAIGGGHRSWYEKIIYIIGAERSPLSCSRFFKVMDHATLV